MRNIAALALGAAALVGCSERRTTQQQVDLNAAAARAQDDIDDYAAANRIDTPVRGGDGAPPKR